jgi:hypothetical protein
VVSRGRALGGVCVALGVAAGLLWGASAAGRAPDGTTAPPGLTGLALVAAAGIAAVVATSGVARRVVGVLLGVAGLVVVVVAAIGVASATPPGGPLLALGGGLLLAAAGAFTVVREPRLARLGARYAAAGSRGAPADPDRAAWMALDEGRDPTDDPPPTAGPGREPAADPMGGAAADPPPDQPDGPRRDQAADPRREPAADRLVDPATDPGADASRKADDPGGGRGGGPV